jgi:hypothetical protein
MAKKSITPASKECSNQEVHLTSGGQSKNRQVENSKEKDSLSKEKENKKTNNERSRTIVF